MLGLHICPNMTLVLVDAIATSLLVRMAPFNSPGQGTALVFG
jgi:hypothetical protein